MAGLAGRVVEDPVLGEVQPHPHRALAQRGVVRGRSAEVLEQVAELLGRHRAQLDELAAVGARPGARVAGPRRALEELELAQAVEQLGPVEHDVEILRALGATARRAGEQDAGGGVELAQRVDREPADRERRSRTIRVRGRSAAPASSAASTDSSNFAPKPRTVRSRCAWAASRSACGESIPSSSKSRLARLAPMPGSAVIATSPAGKRARSLTAAGISPVSIRSAIFCSSVAPMPGISVTRPSRVSAATDRGASRTARAAVRYASTRWTTAPSSS